MNTQNDCFESGIALLCGRPPIFAWSGEQCTVAVLGYLEPDDLLAARCAATLCTGRFPSERMAIPACHLRAQHGRLVARRRGPARHADDPR